VAQGIVRVGDLPQVIPVFPLDGAVLLARGQLPLNIFEPRYLNMIDDAMAGDRQLFTRQDAAELAWKIVEPILDDVSTPPKYKPGTWGPADMKDFAPRGGWVNPT